MNEEIKEILEDIEDYSKNEYLPPCCELTNKDCKLLLDYITNLQDTLKDREEYCYGLETQYKKREQKWLKWETEKSILSTKMAEYLCKWKNIKREYTNQIKCSTQRKRELEEKDKEIKRLKAREQECIDKYLAESKYRSEIEGKYVLTKYIIDELEKWLKEHSIVDYNCNENIIHEQIALGFALDILIELKERVNND